MDVLPSLDPVSSTASIAAKHSGHAPYRTFSSNSSTSVMIDPDPTPRPLRIVKYRSSPAPTFANEAGWATTTAHSASLRRSATISPGSIPERRSSAVPSERTKSKKLRDCSRDYGLPGVEQISPQSHSSSPIESFKGLNVQKHRERGVGWPHPAVLQTTALKKPRFRSAVQDWTEQNVRLFENIESDLSKDNVTDGHSSSTNERIPLQKDGHGRAVTLGTYLETNISSPVLSSAGTGTSVAIFKQGRRRTMNMESQPPSGHHISDSLWKSDSTAIDVQRTSSTLGKAGDSFLEVKRPKRGALFRTVDKLEAWGKSKNMMSVGKSASDASFLRRFSHRRSGDDSRRSSTSNESQATRSRSTTTLSVQPDISEGKNTAEHGQPSDLPLDQVKSRQRGFAKAKAVGSYVIYPQTPPILAARINTIPERKILDTDTGLSMWVAVDIAADVIKSQKCQTRAVLERNALDVVLCFDLSSYTSSSALSNCRSIGTIIACLLNGTKDRLAIVGSAAQGPHKHIVCTVLSSLRPIDLTYITDVLMAIRTSRDRVSSPSSMFDDVLKVSINLLSDSTSPATGDGSGSTIVHENQRRTVKHIFYVSSSGGQLARGIRLPSHIQVHYLNPCMIPWKASPMITNGWQLHLPPSTTDDKAIVNQDVDSMSRDLRKTIESARSQTLCGQLTDVEIIVTAASNCEIVGMLGNTRHDCLRPGQVASILVRVRVGALALPSWRDAGAGTLTEHSHASHHRMLAELDALLGETLQEIIHVEVQHRHSLFPQDIGLSVESTCVIKRCISQQLAGSIPVSPTGDSNGIIHAHQVHSRLASLVASCHPPKEALKLLSDLYGDDRKQPLGIDPRYLQHIAKELRHQARQLKKSGLTWDDHSDYSPPLELTIQPLFVDNHHHNSDRSHDGTDEIALTRPTDQAHNIWLEIRKASKTSAPTTTTTTTTTTVNMLDDDERGDLLQSNHQPEQLWLMWEIADRAVRNKRSVGTDTLKSFALGAACTHTPPTTATAARQGGDGRRSVSAGILGAPWL